MDEEQLKYMKEAIKLSVGNVESGAGGPFGAVIVKNGAIIGRGVNKVTATNDPTAHAEVVAIRDACAHLGSFQLEDCDVYTSCEPCPMCLSAIYWARPKRIFFANTKEDAANIGFDDNFIYLEIDKAVSERSIPAIQIMRDEAMSAFDKWKTSTNKIEY
jgi:tRNA(Arg) A34 adenosine deaminase TadA